MTCSTCAPTTRWASELTLYARLMNLTDERYATAASYSPSAFGRPEKFEYAPGMPRTLYAGFEYRFW